MNRFQQGRHGGSDEWIFPTKLKAKVGNQTGQAVEAVLQAQKITIPAAGGEYELSFAGNDQKWDEFAPELQRMDVTLKAGAFSDTKPVTYGLRELATRNQQFILNGRPILARGAVDEAVYPLTGYRRTYDAIVRWDTTRLISPSADFRYLAPPNDAGTIDNQGKPISSDPIWTAPLITRGNMDYICGYGNSWTALRKWPDLEKDEMPIHFDPKPFARTFLGSPDRVYFNFEHDESAGQPNWSLINGQPYYHLASYEAEYDKGSIGRLLTFDEWDASQAWQALIAYESIKKMRMMDYDGFSWCSLRGGPNTATYQKPLMDYEGVAKLAFYAHNTVFQNTFAGSDNVDVVYRPGDSTIPVIFNLGEARTASLSAQLLTRDGKIIETKNLGRSELTAGRAFVRGKPFRFNQTPSDGAYIVNYILE